MPAVDYFRLDSPAAAIGQELSYTPGAGAAAAPDAPQLRVDYVVVGVVPDFHFRLARQELGPMAFFYDTRAVGQITARVRDDSTQAAVEDARRISTEMFPDTPFDYVFLEDRIADANRDDDRQSQLFAFFAGLALFVSCLGLFALSSFVVAQRTHEIAVRKVLGGSTSGVAQLLMWDFAKPVLIANILAWPLAWIAVRPWLDQFPYRIEPSPVFFIGVSIVALAVALVTVFARTFRAAETRPAIVLRNE